MFLRLFNDEKLEALFTIVLFSIVFLGNVSGDCNVGICEWENWNSWINGCPECGFANQWRSRLLCCWNDWIEQGTCTTNCGKHNWEYWDSRTCKIQCQNGGTSYSYYCHCAGGFTGTCCERGLLKLMFTIKRDWETKIYFHV